MFEDSSLSEALSSFDQLIYSYAHFRPLQGWKNSMFPSMKLIALCEGKIYQTPFILFLIIFSP